MNQEEFPNITKILKKAAKNKKLTKSEIAEYEKYRNRIIGNYNYRRKHPH